MVSHCTVRPMQLNFRLFPSPLRLPFIWIMGLRPERIDPVDYSWPDQLSIDLTVGGRTPPPGQNPLGRNVTSFLAARTRRKIFWNMALTRTPDPIRPTRGSWVLTLNDLRTAAKKGVTSDLRGTLSGGFSRGYWLLDLTWLYCACDARQHSAAALRDG